MPHTSQRISFPISLLSASLFCCNFLQFHGQASKRAQLCHWMNALIYSASASVLLLLSLSLSTATSRSVCTCVWVCVSLVCEYSYECNTFSVMHVQCMHEPCRICALASARAPLPEPARLDMQYALWQRGTQKMTWEHNKGLYLPFARSCV